MLQKFSFIFHLIGTMYFGDDIISSMFISRLYIMPACESDPVWISPRYRFKKTRTLVPIRGKTVWTYVST